MNSRSDRGRAEKLREALLRVQAALTPAEGITPVLPRIRAIVDDALSEDDDSKSKGRTLCQIFAEEYADEWEL
jgi:hypothetical protein